MHLILAFLALSLVFILVVRHRRAARPEASPTSPEPRPEDREPE